MSAWGDLDPRIRDVYARVGARYGLSRDAMRQRVNRGWNPVLGVPETRRGSGIPLQPLPAETRERFTPRVTGPGATDFDDALSRLREQFGDRPKFSAAHQQWFFGHATPAWATEVLYLTADQIEDDAAIQLDAWGFPPDWAPWGVFEQSDRGWVNTLWYH